ncbi:MAG TPA: ATP-binding protein [Streptosporangiaceae bacterium]|nr:ATP-binding protein [Streptosporangiaceae bacterium]
MFTMTPIRPTVQRLRRIPLAAGTAAPAEARVHVRAAICAWDILVDTSAAVLLASELVTNAIRHERGETVVLVLTCTREQLRVEVHDTSPAMPAPAYAPADAEAGRGLQLVASLSDDWGFHRTPAGKAVFFTLAIQGDLDPGSGHRPRGGRSSVR